MYYTDCPGSEKVRNVLDVVSYADTSLYSEFRALHSDIGTNCVVPSVDCVYYIKLNARAEMY